jgi:predicted outer membrane repeat protein
MANLAKFTVQPSTGYQNVETLADISFTNNTTYVLQVVNGGAVLCESTTEPTDEGFVVENKMPIQYTHTSGNSLWVRCVSQFQEVSINIAQ